MASSLEFTSRPRAAWRQRLSSFWRWWSAELRQLVPARYSGATRVPAVTLEGGDLVLADARGAAPSRVAMDTLDPAAQRTALRQILQTAGENRGRVRLRLARDEALVRRVWLPAATEENLAQVIGFEMDRFTPFRADDVYFDHRVVARDPTAAQVQVEIAVARREAVEAKVERLRAWGASVQGVNVADDSSAAAVPLDLLPHEQRGQREAGRDRWLVPVLASVVVALLATALLLPVYQKREAVVALLPQVAQARQQAEAADVIRAALERQVADYNFLMTRKQGTWPALAFIEDVSKLLPDTTWVQQLDVKTIGKNREIQVTGETASSSKLIEIFEQSTVMQNAAPKGAMTRGSTPNSERFMIVAEGRPRPLPPTRPLVEVAETLPNVPPPAAAPPVAPTAPPDAQPAAPPKAPPTATLQPVPPAPPKGAAPPPKGR